MKNNLNKEQQKAVEHIDGPLLILAGAGTGKTATITHRLAYLVNLGIDPSSILTLTFTNKSAKEMRDRSFSLLDGSLTSSPLLCTFHKFGLLFLQLYIHKLDRQNNFVIIDKSDRTKILKNIDNSLPPSYVSSCISEFKNSGFLSNGENTLSHIKDYEKIISIYKKYEKLLIDDNLLDFDDLILLPFIIMNKFQDVRNEISSKYAYVMVDEFQDTNDLQLNLIKQICSNHNNICVVGDDDQSIYSWRGANIKNILDFDKHFKETKKIILNQNYRSSIEILDFANDIIASNSNRYPKHLKSNIGNKEKVDIIYSNNEHEEGMKIASIINKLRKDGSSMSNMAILFRVHAISRSIEEYLNKFNIPYKIIGGIKFYERAEIKDIIAYFRVIELQDDFSLKRIINVPKRGIGKRSVEKMEIASKKKNMKIFDFIVSSSDSELDEVIGARNRKSAKEFAENIHFLQDIAKSKIKSLSYELESSFSIRDYYESMQDSYNRLANIDEFYSYFSEYIEGDNHSLPSFLNDIALQGEQDNIEDEYLYLMSIHASKGLEFENVMVVGLENGVFPIIAEDVDIEEERRLAYVASTRAKHKLTFFSSQSRLYKGRGTILSPSLFLTKGEEMPFISKKTNNDFKIGDVAKHKVFGFGKVIEIKNENNKEKILINFGGNKRELLSAYVDKV